MIKVFGKCTIQSGTTRGIKAVHRSLVDDQRRMALGDKRAAAPRQQGLRHEITHVDG